MWNKASMATWKESVPTWKENGDIVPESFLAWANSQAIITKFKDNIICLMELCTQMNIIVEILRWRPLFLKWGSSWAIKERWPIVKLCVHVLCSIITETEQGCLLVWGSYWNESAYWIGMLINKNKTGVPIREGALIRTRVVNQITVGSQSLVLCQIPISLSHSYLLHI